MNAHREFLDRLDEYVSGSLSGSERSLLEAHLESCPECAGELSRIRSLLERTKELPRAIEPPRDLWPGVEARVGTQGSGSVAAEPARAPAAVEPARAPGMRVGFPVLRLPWVFAGALAATAAIVAILLRPSPDATSALPVESAEQSSLLNPVPGDPGRVSAAPLFVSSLVRALEYQCMGAGKELSASVERSENPFSAEVTATLESDVGTLDRAIAETRAALEADPEDPDLLQMLASRYQRKLSLLHQAIRLAGEA